MTGAAIVTGASRNIGRAIALALAQKGHPVACFGRDRKALEETVALIEGAGGTGSVHVGDVSNDDSLQSLARDTAERYGGIHVVVNNAGIMRENSAQDIGPEIFRNVLDVNLTSAYVLSRAAHAYLKESGDGVVINIGSIFGSIGVSNVASYCASKAGLEGLTRALAAEWARDRIRVMCVAPGYVRSAISESTLSDPVMGKRILSRIPQRRVADPKDVGDFVAFLSSDKAKYITGEVYVIDGGQRMSI